MSARFNKNFVALLFLLPCRLLAEDVSTQPTVTPIENKIAPSAAPATATPSFQPTYFVLANYSYIDMLLPGKYGVTFGHQSSKDNSWEFEYLRISIAAPSYLKDLGSMTEQRYSWILRNISNSGFSSFSYGLSLFDFSVVLGDKFLNGLTGGAYPALDLIKLQSVGYNLGWGSRWTLSNSMILSVDWISWFQPVFVTSKKIAYLDYATDSTQKSEVEAAANLINYLPRFSLLKFQVGLSF